MRLGTRVARLEQTAGPAFSAVDLEEYREAEEVLHRFSMFDTQRCLVRSLAKVNGQEMPTDEELAHVWLGGRQPRFTPEEAELAIEDEKSGRVDEAREVRRRYWLGRGIDVEKEDWFPYALTISRDISEWTSMSDRDIREKIRQYGPMKPSIDAVTAAIRRAAEEINHA